MSFHYEKQKVFRRATDMLSCPQVNLKMCMLKGLWWPTAVCGSDRSWCVSWSRTRGSSRLRPDSCRSTAGCWKTTAACWATARAWGANWASSIVRTSSTARTGLPPSLKRNWQKEGSPFSSEPMTSNSPQNNGSRQNSRTAPVNLRSLFVWWNSNDEAAIRTRLGHICVSHNKMGLNVTLC